MLIRNPTDADEEGWEKQWRDECRTIASRFDKVSNLLTGQSFDSFLSTKMVLMQPVDQWYTALQTMGTASPKEFFMREFFHKRNRIVHFGKIDFQQSDAEMCFRSAATLREILAAMDRDRYDALEKSWQ